jgi:WD40 repeat protein
LKITQCSFSPNGELIAASAVDGSLRIWNVATGREKHVFQIDTKLLGCTFSPDGNTMALYSNKTLELWDLTTGVVNLKIPHWVIGETTIAKFKKKLITYNIQNIQHCLFSPDGKTLAIISKDDFEIRDSTTGTHFMI